MIRTEEANPDLAQNMVSVQLEQMEQRVEQNQEVVKVNQYRLAT